MFQYVLHRQHCYYCLSFCVSLLGCKDVCSLLLTTEAPVSRNPDGSFPWHSKDGYPKRNRWSGSQGVLMVGGVFDFGSQHYP